MAKYITKDGLTELYLRAKREAKLPIFVVTGGTKDFGSKFVARLHISSFQGNMNNVATEHYAVAENLQELREGKPDDCRVLARNKNDDPVIIETWF